MKDEGATSWYECEGCGEVVDAEYRPDGSAYHVNKDGLKCGPVRVVTG